MMNTNFIEDKWTFNSFNKYIYRTQFLKFVPFEQENKIDNYVEQFLHYSTLLMCDF